MRSNGPKFGPERDAQIGTSKHDPHWVANLDGSALRVEHDLESVLRVPLALEHHAETRPEFVNEPV
jgi:hypothetical protein